MGDEDGLEWRALYEVRVESRQLERIASRTSLDMATGSSYAASRRYHIVQSRELCRGLELCCKPSVSYCTIKRAMPWARVVLQAICIILYNRESYAVGSSCAASHLHHIVQSRKSHAVDSKMPTNRTMSVNLRQA